MKKLLSFVLAIVLVLPNFLSLQAFAAGTDLSDNAQIIELAKRTFPEYADKIDGDNFPSRSEPRTVGSELSIVIQETRAADNNTNMTYTEYNNGLVTLGTVRFATSADLTVEDSESYSGYVLYTATIVASVIEGPTFTATDVQYRIYPSAYDRITSVGNYGIPGYTDEDFDVFLRSNETASLFACASYSFPCPVGGLNYDGDVILKLSNNVPTVEFDVWY